MQGKQWKMKKDTGVDYELWQYLYTQLKIKKMKKVQEMTNEELQQLLADVKKEIENREAKGNGFDREFFLDGKAYRPATYEQFKFAQHLADKTGSKIDATGSQIIKRMERDDMSDAIELMKDGKKIRIY